MNRREFAVTSVAALGTLANAAEQPPAAVNMGLLIYSYGKRASAGKDKGFSEPVNFLEFAKSRGANALQMSLGSRNEADSKLIRQAADKLGMHIEGIVSPPKDNRNDLERFGAELTTARECGAGIVRTVLLGGRRYEVFEKAEDYAAFAKRAEETLRMAEPVAKEMKVVLAVENHKDFRTDEQIDLLKKFGSDWLGVCLDTGNNLALLEDPAAVVSALAPFARSVHLKDIGVEEYPDGFRMAEVPLGQGLFDLNAMIATIRKANPKVRFQLEMITRDPLLIPCLSEKYWATLAKVLGRDLARALASVRRTARKTPLPMLSKMTPDEQLAVEDRNVRESFAYAAQLGL